MPYIQVDLPARYPAEVKRALAAEVGELFAREMRTTTAAVNVGFRELGADNLHRWRGGSLEPVALIHCDVRRGRPAEQREGFARALVEAAAARLDWPVEGFVVEFTQHAGDEMFRDGGFAPEWGAEEEGGGGEGAAG